MRGISPCQYLRSCRGLGLLFILAGLMALAGPARADDAPPPPGLPDYWEESRFLVDVPGASNSIAAGLFNPAAWPVRPSGGIFLAGIDPAGPNDEDEEESIGIVSLRSLAFGIRTRPLDEALGRGGHWNEYTVGIGGGDRGGGFGLSYAWSRDGEGDPLRHDRLTAGFIRRWRPVSVGVSYAWDLDAEDYDRDGSRQFQVDLGVRPIGPRLTLFAEAVSRQGDDLGDLRTGYGFEVLPLRGVALGAKALNTGEYGVRLQIGLFGGLHPDVRTFQDNDHHHIASLFAVETDLPTPDLGRGPRGKQYPELDLKGPLAYERYRFFDKRRTLLGTLRQLDAYATDPQVGGVVLNLSGLEASPAVCWELRDQLAGLRAQGKKVIIYFDRVSIAGYGLASVADQLWMDPVGDLAIPGIAFGRTYLSTMLGKLGLGVDELRFFTYKSAAEIGARTSMSPPEREQRQALVDDAYETVADLVTSARGIPRDAWDTLIDEHLDLDPKEARAAGLIDSVGTCDQAFKAARAAVRRATPDRSAATLAGVAGDPAQTVLAWGEPDRVALLYAIGDCAMETGIRGPVLAAAVKRAREDRRVKAVVLRVDSPGGDRLPSDLVAREMIATAAVKPVIVSQGSVAASGGYYLSMEADTIVTSPLTRTGSIGVISAFAWDNGLGAKVGLAYDGVRRGAHANYLSGWRLPFAPAALPHRPMGPEERARAEYLIRTMYAEFVGRVAAARDRPVEEIEALAQGRVWSGTRALELDLVDVEGGLWEALRLARQRAGLPRDRPVELVEGPAPEWIDPALITLVRIPGLEGSAGPQVPGPTLHGLAEGQAPGPTLHGLAEGLGSEAPPCDPAAGHYLDMLLSHPGVPLLLAAPDEVVEVH